MTAAEANALVDKLADRFHTEAYCYGFQENAHAYMVGAFKTVLSHVALHSDEAAAILSKITARE